MLIEQHLESVKLRFKWRRLISAAVKDARAEMLAKKEHGAGHAKYKKTDPTGDTAVKNISGIKSVRILPRRGGTPVYIQEPEKWLAVIDTVFSEYEEKSPFVAQAMHTLMMQKYLIAGIVVLLWTRWQKMKLGKINRLQIMTDYLIDENIPFEVVFTGKGKPIKIRAWNKYQPWNDGEVQLLPSGQIDSYCGKGENLFEPDLNVYDACAELKRHYEFDFLKHSEELA